jgi:uncharacterized membrane protein
LRYLEKKTVLSFVLVLLFIGAASFTFAQEYYADLTINILSDGNAIVSGLTNDPAFSSGIHSEFTSKKGVYWLLNISSKNEFSDYILTLKLPDGSEINYLRTEGRSRISYDSGIKIVASGSNQLDLIVQYKIDESKKSSFFYFWLILVGAGLIIVGVIVWRKFSKKAKNINRQDTKNEKSGKNLKINAEKEVEDKLKDDGQKKLTLIKKTLSESQAKIIDLILDAGGELTQKQLQHRSGLPKATLSRNIDNLVKKNILIKQSRGMTNMLLLNKEL